MLPNPPRKKRTRRMNFVSGSLILLPTFAKYHGTNLGSNHMARAVTTMNRTSHIL
jgi:hypothetical protein